MLKQGIYIDILTDKIFNSKNVKLLLENDNQNENENEIELHNRTQINTNKNKEINPRSSSKTSRKLNDNNNNNSNSNSNSRRSSETSKKEKLEINNHLIAKNVAAFVTFEYAESMARAIEDCQYYSSYFRNYPEKMKFFENKLIICVPPGPDEIVWEHLEATKFQKWMRRTRTMIMSFLLLVVCFLATLGANVEQGQSNYISSGYCF